MATRTTSYGICELCSKRTSKGAMTRHLKTCAQAHEVASDKATDLFHLRVEDPWAKNFWIHVELKGEATLLDLDRYLRALWLECCGHLSAFEIGEVSYDVHFNPRDRQWRKARGMDIKVKNVLSSKAEFSYQYDFGSTTELGLKVLDTRQGKSGKAPVRLLARNEAPVWECGECERPAQHICVECQHEGYPFVCDDHSAEHPCGEDMLLPVVNSPRMGVCGYTGD